MNEVRLIDANALKEAMMKAFGCEDATKYGNKNAEQQANSYSTLMLYEISDIVEDCIDNAPTVEIGKCTLESDKAFICGYEKGKNERPKGKDDVSCQYCKYEDKRETDYPCNICKNNHVNMFEWKEDNKG